jgi:membrane-bound serine protease (ClpP class)
MPRIVACRLLGVILVLLGAHYLATPPARAQQDQDDTVFVVQIRDVIDLGLAPYLARVLDQADQAGAQAVILEIDTPGGRLDAALQMRDALLGAPTRTIALVNREALSAGALIAISADAIYMAPGAVIGAATPVDSAGNAADAKTISAVRSIFRATAELGGRDPAVAEAMVDPAVVIPGVTEADQLLTLTTSQAQQAGYADGVASSRQELLALAGLAGASVQETEPALAENVVRFLTHPAIAGLLIAVGLLLIVADLMVGGFGAVGAVGVGLLALFFWGHFLAGLAGWEAVVLVALGVALIGAEIFVIPGFGIAGLLGLVALIAGLFLALIGERVVTNADLARAGATVTGALLGLIAGVILLARALPRMGRLHGLILQAQVGGATEQRRQRRVWLEGPRLEAQTAPSEQQRRSLRGARGVALSQLRPGGVAQIDGERVDVVTQGDYIAAGESIEVIADEGYRRVVRRLGQPAGKE